MPYTLGGKPLLWIIIPCYNEQDVLPVTAPIFLKKLHELIALKKISEKSRILFVDDGSRDATWEIICDLACGNEHFLGIRQSRNRGHQNALLAGLMEAKDSCDVTISIDCDGQDDIDAMNEMIDKFQDGYEIVYGVRSDRESDTWFKRTTAQTFYKIMRIMGAEVIDNHADYRLASANALQHLANFQEVNVFLRGLFPLVGFRSASVFYKRRKRIAGATHYPLKKMLSLAFDGITSFSIKPIRLITTLGVVMSFFGALGIVATIIARFTTLLLPPGWASMVCILLFLEGIQLFSLGVIGEYIGKTYMETKHRPRYIISARTGEPIIPHRERSS